MVDFQMNRTWGYFLLGVGAAVAGGALSSFAPPLAYLGVLGVVIGSWSGLGMMAEIKRKGLDIFLGHQKPDEIIVLYHSKSGRVIPIRGKEYQGYIKLIDHWGRIRNTGRSSYILFGKKVVHSLAGTAHTISPRAAVLTNQLADKDYHSLGEAILGELGREKIAAMEGENKLLVKEIFEKEGITI